MSDDRCKCSMSISMLGDGCRYCQPQDYIDRLHDQINNPEPTHYAVIDEHGEIVQAFKVKSIISAKEDCVRFIASISKFQDDPERLKGWTVKGVTVHE